APGRGGGWKEPPEPVCGGRRRERARRSRRRHWLPRLRPFPLPPVLLLPTRRRSPEAPRRRAPYPLPAIEFPSPVRRREPEAPPPPCPSASPQPAGPTPPDLRPERASGPLPPRPSPHPHREV